MKKDRQFVKNIAFMLRFGRMFLDYNMNNVKLSLQLQYSNTHDPQLNAQIT